MGFSRQEYWSGLPVPPPGDLPDSGIEPASPAAPALAGFFTRIIPWTEEAGRLYSPWAHKESDAIEAVDPTLCFRQATR